MRVSFNDPCPTALNVPIILKVCRRALCCRKLRTRRRRFAASARPPNTTTSGSFTRNSRNVVQAKTNSPSKDQIFISAVHLKLADQSAGRRPSRGLTADYWHQKPAALRPAIVPTLRDYPVTSSHMPNPEPFKAASGACRGVHLSAQIFTHRREESINICFIVMEPVSEPPHLAVRRNFSSQPAGL